MGCSSLATPPIAFIFHYEVKPDAVAEFVKIYTENAVASRPEPGCIRFDLLRDPKSPNKFISYEVFRSDAAHAEHRQTPCMKAWGAFKYREGKPVETVVRKMELAHLSLSQIC